MADRPLRVLLVEDDEDDYVLTRDLFADVDPDGFAVEWVRDGAAARPHLTNPAHDVWLVDYRLPDTSGIDLVREAAAAGLPAPVILLTGQGGRTVDVEGMRAGAADFLAKAELNAAVLERSVRYAIERKRAETQLRQLHDELEQRVRDRTAALSAEVEARTRLEEELRRRMSELAEADRHKDDFLAMLGHELRNPLAPIRNALQILRRTGEAEAREWAQGVMERQVRHLSRLVDDLLDVSRVSRGKVHLRRQTVDLAAVVRDTAGDHAATLADTGLDLDLRVPDGPVWVHGDPVRLAQILGNLLTNAAKFTDSGGRVSVALQAADGRATLKVRDTGIGIEASLLPHLFERFIQADRGLERTRGGLGLGLGLALVRGLAELHGGGVAAHSDGPGTGSEFTVRLPTAAPPAERHPADAPAAAEGAAHRVLIIEDNRDSAESLRMLLELSGHEVRLAHTGEAGIDLAREWRPDLVLCDLGLPGKDGFQVAGTLKADPVTAATRLIAVSGYGQDDDRQRSRDAGFDAHLTKPVELEQLEEMLAAG